MRLSYSEIRQRCLKPDEAEKPLYPRYVTHTFSAFFAATFPLIILGEKWFGTIKMIRERVLQVLQPGRSS